VRLGAGRGFHSGLPHERGAMWSVPMAHGRFPVPPVGDVQGPSRHAHRPGPPRPRPQKYVRVRRRGAFIVAPRNTNGEDRGVRISAAPGEPVPAPVWLRPTFRGTQETPVPRQFTVRVSDGARRDPRSAVGPRNVTPVRLTGARTRGVGTRHEALGNALLR
jgi:hypothetical protein